MTDFTKQNSDQGSSAASVYPGGEGDAAKVVCPACGKRVNVIHANDPAQFCQSGRFGRSAATAHPEDSCEECGGPNVVWFAPNDLWNRVMRGGDRGAPDVFGIVCPTCFILRAEAAGVEATGWLVQPEVILGRA